MFVYAPLGLAVQVKDELPQLVQKGRDTVTGPGAMYRSVGMFAAQQARNVAERHAGGVHDLLTSVGLLPPQQDEPGGASDQGDDAAPDPAADDATEVDPVIRDDAAEPPPLGIDDYDVRPAAEIVPLLADLSDEQRAAVRDHETRGRGRRTILGRLDQLEGAE